SLFGRSNSFLQRTHFCTNILTFKLIIHINISRTQLNPSNYIDAFNHNLSVILFVFLNLFDIQILIIQIHHSIFPWAWASTFSYTMKGLKHKDFLMKQILHGFLIQQIQITCETGIKTVIGIVDLFLLSTTNEIKQIKNNIAQSITKTTTIPITILEKS
ncbi:hypothetical protein ACJX0J_038535, partial [Zea mays]